jgi:WD40 repeat protein/Tfp pilus assembly protein PilF/predicted Ser/Thr protein kinase
MKQTSICHNCGTMLHGTAVEGLCPRCLLVAVAGIALDSPGAFGRGSVQEQPGAVQTSQKIPDPLAASRTEVSPASGAAALRRFGDYELLEQIGRGGMGVVYRARQVGLDRIVAVKMILFGPFAGERAVQRFHNEARSAASLHHPNIVAVYEVGEYAGQHFFSMDYVEGRSLAQLIAEGKLRMGEFKRAAAYLKQIAEAIQYAHERGILHRDLKPSNVLIDANDHPRITDFGLAKRLSPESATANPQSAKDLTLSGQVLGSPNFMPPEQASGQRDQVGPPSDVYSLGAILYYLLTGRPPFAAERVTEVLQQLVNDEPVAPRLLNPRVPRDLEIICLKCLNKEPRRRYASALALAEDLQHWSAGEPIVARPVGPTARAWRWCRRKPALAASFFVIALLVGLVTIGSPIVLFRINRERQRAASSAKAEEHQRQRAEQNLVRQYVANGNRLVAAGDTLGALPWFAEALVKEQNSPARADIHRLRLASTLEHSPKLLQVWTHTARINAAQFSADGRWAVTASDDRTARLWDAATGELAVPPLVHAARVLHAAFSPDSRVLVTACSDGTVRVWNVTNGQPITPPLQHGERRPASRVFHASFSPDSHRIVTSSENGTAQVWEAQTGAAVFSPLKHLRAVRHAEFSRDGRFIVTASDDREARIWDAATGQLVGRPMRHEEALHHAEFSADGEVVLTAGLQAATLWYRPAGERRVIEREGTMNSARFSPTGQRFVLGLGDYAVRFHNTSDGKSYASHGEHDQEVLDAEFSPDGAFVVTASRDTTARVWEAEYGKPVTGPLWHPKPVVRAVFSPDNHRVLTVSEDNRARLWETATALPLARLLRPDSVVLHAAFSVDGQRVLTVGLDGQLDFWNGATGERAGPVVTNVGTIRHAEFSPDGQRFATATAEGRAQVWDIATGQPISPPLQHNGPINHVEFSPDGGRVVTAGSDRWARVWDVASGQQICSLQHSGAVRVARFTPDGQAVVTATLSAWLTIVASGHTIPVHLDVKSKNVWLCRWDAQTGQPVTPPVKLSVRADRVVFSRDGRHALTTYSDPQKIDGNARRCQVWDVATSQPVSATPFEHADAIWSAAFSADGARVVTASRDHTARVWDTLSGKPLTPPLEHREDVLDAVFALDGRLIVTASSDHTARVWDAATGEPVSPPIQHQPKLKRLFVSSDGRRFLTATMAPRAQLWALPSHARSVQEYARQAQLLSSHQVDETGGLAVLSPEATQALWEQWRAGEPADFTTAPQRVQSWRQHWADEFARIEARRHQIDGAFFVKQRLLPEAADRFSKAIELAPDDYDLYWLRAEVYSRLGQVEKGEADLKRVIQLNPFHYQAFNQLGWLYLSGPPSFRSPEQALPHALKMAELQPDTQPALSLLGQVYYRLEKLDEARKALENDRPTEKESIKAADWLVLAMIYQRRGESAKAQEYYRKAEHWRQAPDQAASSSQLKEFYELLAEADEVLGKPKAK